MFWVWQQWLLGGICGSGWMQIGILEMFHHSFTDRSIIPECRQTCRSAAFSSQVGIFDALIRKAGTCQDPSFVHSPFCDQKTGKGCKMFKRLERFYLPLYNPASLPDRDVQLNIEAEHDNWMQLANSLLGHGTAEVGGEAHLGRLGLPLKGCKGRRAGHVMEWFPPCCGFVKTAFVTDIQAVVSGSMSSFPKQCVYTEGFIPRSNFQHRPHSQTKIHIYTNL